MMSFNTSVLIFSALSISKTGYYCIEKILLQIFLWIVRLFWFSHFTQLLMIVKVATYGKKRDCLYQNQSSFKSEVMHYREQTPHEMKSEKGKIVLGENRWFVLFNCNLE